MLLHPKFKLSRWYHPSKENQQRSRNSYNNQAIICGADHAEYNPILVLIFLNILCYVFFYVLLRIFTG